MDTVKQSLSEFARAFNIPWSRQLLRLPLLLVPKHDHPESIFSAQSEFPIDIQQSCPNPSISCPSITPSPVDTCCLNHPSGHFLLAQFWDTQPSLGPNNSWTLHGLWPDLCTGGYDAYCDRSRDLSAPTIATIVDEASKTTRPGLRSYMDEYWKGLHGDDDLWSHEWNKHGTCVSTLETKCYDTSETTSRFDSHHGDLLDYLTAATSLHSTLRTHDVLASHGIVPSHTETYNLDTIQSALASEHGFIATVKCNPHHELNEIWMHYTVVGSLRNSTSDPEWAKLFVPVVPDGLKSNCPRKGIRYLPKSDSGHSPGPTHTSHLPKPTGVPFEGRGHLRVHVLSSEDKTNNQTFTFNEGCLIRQGYWYTSGQCATYRAKADIKTTSPSHLFTLASSYAPCAILEQDGRQGQRGEFVCDNHLPVQSIFDSEDKEGSAGPALTWKGQSVFYAEKIPGRFDKVRIFGDDGDGDRKVKLAIYWESV